MSCKNQSHLNACKQWHKHLSACKNDTSSPAGVSDDTGSLARVSDDIGRPIRLWHVSPIELRHLSFTHPQTPINRSLPKAFKRRTEDLEVQKLYKNQASKPWRTSTPKLKNTRSRIIQTMCLDSKVYGNQAQSSEKNINKPQIGEALRIQASKVLKNFHHKPSKTKNTRRTQRTWRTKNF